MLALNAAKRLEVSKGGKSRAMRLKRKKADDGVKMDLARVESDARNARQAELEARATELEKQIEHIASQARVAESKYLLLNDENQM